MKTLLSITICILNLPVWGQTFGKIDEKHIAPDELKRVYDYYVNSEFSDVAHELAKRTGDNPVLQGYISDDHLKSPWKHSLELTFSSAWQLHTDYATLKETRGKKFETLMKVLEDKKVGSGRSLALQAIATRLHWGRQTPIDTSLPPMENTVDRLRTIVFDKSEGDSLRNAILPVLYEHHDPSEYLELAIELSSKQHTPLTIAEAFRFATPIRGSAKLSKQNRSKYLVHAFQLLTAIDDKMSGHGYFLAMHIGSFIGIEPVRDGQGPFAPDQRLKQYQGKHGLKDTFFQKTVDNAIDWWEQNKQRYESEQSPAGDDLKAAPEK
jgi:hypothetical protein